MSLFPGAGPSLPAPRRIDYAKANALYKKQKASLTRAKKSGDPVKVLEAVEKALDEWDGPEMFWPDGWATWRIALEDAAWELRRSECDSPHDLLYRFNAAHDRFA